MPTRKEAIAARITALLTIHYKVDRATASVNENGSVARRNALLLEYLDKMAAPDAPAATYTAAAGYVTGAVQGMLLGAADGLRKLDAIMIRRFEIALGKNPERFPNELTSLQKHQESLTHLHDELTALISAFAARQVIDPKYKPQLDYVLARIAARSVVHKRMGDDIREIRKNIRDDESFKISKDSKWIALAAFVVGVLTAAITIYFGLMPSH